MPNQGTESQFEATTIERLEALGYRYEYGGGITRELHEVVITDWVRSFLSFRYPHLNAEAVEAAVMKASRPEGVTAVQRNMNCHALLTRGFEQRYRRPDGSEDIEHVHLVDWQNVENNDLCVVNQLSIRGQNDRRPDVLIYLNGFPVVLFELKNPYEEEPNTLGAFNQVQHYKAGISQLFDFNALVVVSDGGMIVPVSDDAPKEAGSTLHGPWTASWEWFAPWKSIDGREVMENVTGAMKLASTPYQPRRHWRQQIDRLSAHLVISGTANAGIGLARLGRPFVAWLATDLDGDRRDRVGGFPWYRRALDRGINARVLRAYEREVLHASHPLALSRHTERELNRVAGATVVRAVLPSPINTVNFNPSAGSTVPRRIVSRDAWMIHARTCRSCWMR